MKNLAPVITIDGSSGAGKSILCQKISKALKWNLLESGFMYRLVSFIILKNKLAISNKDIHVIEQYLNFYLDSKKDIFCNIFLEKKLILQDVVNFSSKIASDMGTVVFPDAIIKIFLDADIKIRVKRRVLELHNKGINANFDTVLCDMEVRDQRDRKRFCSPLLVAKNALKINSTNISIEEVFDIAITAIYKKLN